MNRSAHLLLAVLGAVPMTALTVVLASASAAVAIGVLALGGLTAVVALALSRRRDRRGLERGAR